MSDKKLWEQYVALEKERDTLRSDLAEFQYAAAVANDTIKALQAKVEQMEKQEPVAWMSSRNGFICKENKNPDYNVPLYALPGAQPAPSVPEVWIQRGMAELEAIRSRQDDDTLLDDRTLIERIGKAMLAAAPEAKP